MRSNIGRHNEQQANEFERRSTLGGSSSEDSKSNLSTIQEQEENYQQLENLLASDITGDKLNGKQRIVVESMFYDISGEKTMIFQIPCFLSADKTTFYVFINEEKLKFNQTALFNLVDTAEKASENCQKLIFVLKRDTEQYAEMKPLLSLIDAVRMSQS
jgi:hypothetical protein